MDPTAQIIVAYSTLVTAVTAAIIGLINAVRINKVQRQTNGLMAEMKASAKAEGNLQGRADEKEDQALKVADPLKVEIVKVPPISAG